MGFFDSLGANAVLFGAYLLYQLFNRVLHSKCMYNRDGGLDFDLGDTNDAVADMDRIAELIKSRSLMHKNNNSNSGSVSV